MHGIRLLFFFISTFLRCFGFLFHSLQKFYFILKTNYLADFHRTGVLEKTAYIILYSLFFLLYHIVVSVDPYLTHAAGSSSAPKSNGPRKSQNFDFDTFTNLSLWVLSKQRVLGSCPA